MNIQDRVQTALEEHLAANGGGFVSAWHFIADAIDEDGDQVWLYAAAPEQQQMTTMGLIEWARGVARFEQHHYLSGHDDDMGDGY